MHGPLLNIFSLVVLDLLFLFTYLVKKGNKMIYATHVVTVLIIGILALIFGEDLSYVGEMIILAGVLLVFIYRLIENYSYKTVILLIIGIAGVRLFAGYGDIRSLVTTVVSCSMVLFMWTLLRREMNLYIRESQKNETLCRIGMNAANFLHNMHLSTLEKLLQRTRKYTELDDINNTRRYLEYMQKWTAEKINLRDKIVTAVKNNRTTEKELLDLHEVINSVLESLFFDRDVIQQITIIRDFNREDLYLEAVPFEIYFILQNTLLNAIEALLKSPRMEKTLIVSTRKNSGYLNLIISDSGPGFPMKKNAIDLRSTKIGGGYGTDYITALVKNYNGTVIFTNNPGGGARVEINIPGGKGKENEK